LGVERKILEAERRAFAQRTCSTKEAKAVMSKFEDFSRLHVAGDPLVLFNAWDPGSAAAVAKSGAKAIATGSASVSMANGFGDGQEVPLELALANAERIVNAVDLPVTVDFEGGYATDSAGLSENGRLLAETGAIGCNFEDQVVGTDRLYEITDQVQRIAALRAGVGKNFFINARTDLFLKAKAEAHDSALADQAIERGRAYANAGVNGYFIPGLADLSLVERITKAVNLPINAMHLPNGPSRIEWASAGIARVSHGPFPFMAMQDWLTGEAKAALS
jgi:2-methylisocitrate lyase-like PEP mutase family enzyme